MRTIRLKVADLFEFEGKPPSGDFGTIIALAVKQFGFLPQPVVVQVEGNEIAIQYPEESSVAQRLWRHWQERAQNLGPGDEYCLVDEFADMTGLRDWYEWRPDPGHHDATAEPLKQGTTNPALLKVKQPAAVFYFLDAFKRFDAMTPEQVRDVVFEIALLGRNGLDYAAPDEKYELRALPDRKFSGLHLMCLMFAGFKRVAPEHDVGMDLNDSFLAALQLNARSRWSTQHPSIRDSCV
jgi:hypothetical protein